MLGPPKTRAGVRSVALPAVVGEALETHLERFAEPGAQGLVFPAPSGGLMRRSAASTGATTKELMSRIGHSSPAAALRYQHVVSGRDEAIAAGIDALIGRAEPAPSAPLLAVDKNRSGTLVARRSRRACESAGL